LKKLTDSVKENIEKEIKLISDYLFSWDKIKVNRNSNHIGILSGLPGVTLALLDYLQVEPSTNNSQKKILKEYLQNTFKILENSEYITSTYCDGLSGYGFFLLKLKSHDFIDENDGDLLNDIDEILNDIDDILLEHIEEFYQQDNLDILHGLVGLGLYFLEREHTLGVDKITEIIMSKVFRTEEGYVYWRKYDKYDNYKSVIDLGNAHGMGANIFFLTKVLSKTPENEEIKEIIDSAIGFFLDNSQEITDEIYCYYPLKIEADAYDANSFEPSNSRLGWCYGDLGTLYTLLMASKHIDNKKYYDIIVDKLAHVATRTYDKEGFIIDAGFCHGTSGIALLFNNVYDITGKDVFWKTATYWLEQTLIKKDNTQPEGYVNYGFVIENSDEKNISILEGLAGLLVSYLKFLHPGATISEELLMIKY